MSEVVIDASAGLMRCEHRRVAIIGAGSSRLRAPWHDDSWCFWALNEIGQPRFDRHFELHPMAVQTSQELEWLSKCPTPCYVLSLHDVEPRLTNYRGAAGACLGVANAVEYPLERVLKMTGGRRYFTCTFAYQVALAVAEDFEEIGLWGVDLDLGTPRERLVEKPCLEYWLGFAEGCGIKVTLPRGATLLRRDGLYGYDYHEEKAEIDRVVASFPSGPKDLCPACLGEMGPVEP